MSFEVLDGSLVLALAWLLAGGLGAPLPEDVALIGIGVLVERGVVDPVLALATTFAGVLGGDLALFFLARRVGARDRRWLRRILSPARRQRLEAAFDRYGARLVFAGRYLMGMRAAVFAMAGMHGMSPRRFLLWDAAAACISVPLLVALGYGASGHAERVRAHVADVQAILLLAVVVALATYVIARRRRAVSAPGP